MKKIGESAIHDDGFQFYLTLNIKSKIKDLIHDIHILEDCIKWHKECVNENWYNSKTKLGINSKIEGYESMTQFTLTECKKIFKERKEKYDLLMEICESALNKAIKNTNEEKVSGETRYFGNPYSKDEERKYVIVDELEDE